MLRFACLAVPLAVAAGAAAPVPKDLAAQILVVTKTGDKSRLTLMNDDGSAAKDLTDDKSNASYPAWSPDGKRIAFASDRDGGVFHLFVMNADGSDVKQLTKGALKCRVPSWSPDGKTIAFCRATEDGSSEIATVGVADGKNLKRLTSAGWVSTYATWSQDGKRLACIQSRKDGAAELVAMDPDGKNPKVLVKGLTAVEGGRPQWRPKK